MKKSMLKKIALLFVGGLVVVGLILAVIPSFIDVDAKLRPIIIQNIEENLDVKAELGALSLSLLWGVRVEVGGLKVTEVKTKNVLFELKKAKLHIPFLSLLTGNVSVTLETQEPVVRVVRYKDGSLNISKVLKQGAQKPPENGATAEGSSAAGLVGGRIQFSTDIKRAQLLVKDEVTGFDFKVEDLNLKLSNVGLNRPFEMWLQTQLNINNKKDIQLLGTLEYEGASEIKMTSSGFETLELNSELDLSGIEIKHSNLMNKAKDIPLKIKTNLVASKTQLQLQEVRLLAGNFDVGIKGEVLHLDTQPELKLLVQTNELDLADWKAVLAPVKNFDLEGRLNLNLNLAGTLPKVLVDGDVHFKNGSLKVPGIQPRLTDVQMNAQMSGQKIRIKETSLKIGKSDLSLSGSVSGFEAPEIDFDVSSKNLDLDEMFPKQSAAAVEEKNKALKAEPAQDVSAAVEGPMASLQKNMLIKAMDFKARTKVKKLVVQSAVIEDVVADTYFKGLILTIKNASLKAFQGTAKAFFQLDMSATLPAYQLSADVAGIDINQAVVSQFKELDKTITGRANGNIILSGVGLKTAQVKNNMKGSGKFNIKEGAWSGAVPLKKIGEKLSKIPKAGEKLSGLKLDDKFRAVNMDFSIQKGELIIQKALIDTTQANTAIEASGTVDFDQNLRMKGNILAPIKDVPKDLKSADGRGKIPFELQGKATAPEVEWEKTIQVVGKAYIKDEGKKILNKGLEKAKEELGGKVKDLFKGIRF